MNSEEEYLSVVGYIFGTLKTSENAIKIISRDLRRQNKINRRNTLFAIGTVAYLYFTDMQYKKEKEKLEKKLEDQEKLIIRIDAELHARKNKKGEAQM